MVSLSCIYYCFPAIFHDASLCEVVLNVFDLSIFQVYLSFAVSLRYPAYFHHIDTHLKLVIGDLTP